ncbi:inorganic triphosphatase [Candidatus Poribacteria bacterium]
MEIESKYKASEAQLADLLGVYALGGYRLGDIEEQSLTDYYVDTAERDIWEAGYACRIREKNGQWVLAVKGLGGVEGSIHQREEYEVEVQQDTPPELWPDSPARDLVISLARSRPLVDLCTINQRRTKRAVHQGQRRVGEMSLDIVDMGSGARIYEVEVELQQDGTLKDLQALDEILQTCGLQPESRSKFERAMAQLD